MEGGAITRSIEWPPGSGVIALYSPYEMNIVLGVIAAAERAGTDAEEISAEVAFIHQLKATFDGTLW